MSNTYFLHALCIALSLISSLAASHITQTIGNPIGTNFPTDAEGRVYHLGLKKGEIANNILLVGDPDRAKLICCCFDNPQKIFSYASNRGFTTYTGTKNGKPVTVMSIGMGLPMMDFAVREIRAITDGPLSIIRLGSCGTPHDTISIGTIVVANESYGIITDYDALHTKTAEHSSSSLDYYTLTSTLTPDIHLHEMLVKALENESAGTFPVVVAQDATADSFYSSQGRRDPNFDDKNKNLIDCIMKKYPNTASLQMETYHLFHLARLNSYATHDDMGIRVAACAMVLAQRKSDNFLSNELKHKLEIKTGNACLNALTQ